MNAGSISKRPFDPIFSGRVDLALLVAFTILFAVVALRGFVGGGVSSPAVSSFGSFPLAFIPNQGQAARDVQYETFGLSSHLAFTASGVRMTLPGRTSEPKSAGGPSLDVRFLGANPDVRLTAGSALPATVNYFRGNNSEGWIAGLQTYDSIRYQSLYDGVDLVYEGQDGQLKSTYELAQGADPAQLRSQYQGAEALSTDRAGNLVIGLADGSQVIERTPSAWQEVGGRQVPVSVAYALAADGAIGFTLGAYNTALPLIIDPTFVYQTALNGAEFESGLDIAVDAAGNAYVVARAYNTNNDVWVVKLTPSGDFAFGTFLIGSSLDYGFSIDLDNQGNVVVVGETDSQDFPVLNAYQSMKIGGRDAFITKLSAADGSLLLSTYFGANRADAAYDLAFNDGGELYIIGQSDSTDLITVNPIQSGLNLTSCFCDDAFITKFSADVQQVLYSTYLGGSLDDWGRSIGLDADENIYFAGWTHSPDFPTQNPLQTGNGGGDFDGFVSKISADGSQLVYSTYLGGDDTDYLKRIAVNEAGYAFVTGLTRSPDFPTTSGAFQEDFVGGILACGSAGFDLRNCDDVFLTSYTPDGSAYAYSTFLGGSLDDDGSGIVLDEGGRAYLVGFTNSADFPLNTQGPGAYIFVSRLSADGSDLDYTVTVWSAVANAGHGITRGADGDLYITGAINVPSDTYIARLTENGTPPPTSTPGVTPPATATATPRATRPPTSTPPGSTPPPTSTPTATAPPPTATPPAGSTIHIGDLDGSSTWVVIDRKWTASVVIAVHDKDENPLANATVYGSWNAGSSRTVQCTTAADGICTITSNQINKNFTSTTFSVTDVTHPTNTYFPGDNQDPDGDSDGTNITIAQP